MSKKLFAFFMIIGLCCATAALAQEQKGSTLLEWLKAVQQKIDKILPKKEIATSTGVAGVRGAKQGTAAKLYWKDKKGEAVVSEEELAKFKACVELAGKGDCAAATKELEMFMKQYPDSALIPDAKKTIDIVKAEPKIESKPAVSAEQNTEGKPVEKKVEAKEDAKEDMKDETKKTE